MLYQIYFCIYYDIIAGNILLSLLTCSMIVEDTDLHWSILADLSSGRTCFCLVYTSHDFGWLYLLLSIAQFVLWNYIYLYEFFCVCANGKRERNIFHNRCIHMVSTINAIFCDSLNQILWRKLYHIIHIDVFFHWNGHVLYDQTEWIGLYRFSHTSCICNHFLHHCSNPYNCTNNKWYGT